MNSALLKVRVDKYLWAVRVFKTRSLASTFCNSGKVKVNGRIVKASYQVREGDEFVIRISHTYEKIILAVKLIDKRVGADKLEGIIVDKSAPPPKLNQEQSAFEFPSAKRIKGSGRPTKKEGRDLKKFGW